jgi:hypothetical protein
VKQHCEEYSLFRDEVIPQREKERNAIVRQIKFKGLARKSTRTLSRINIILTDYG